MKKFTKILSVALVVVMMFSMVAFNTSALADGAAFGLVLKADKTEAEIVPGAAVTVTIHFAMADWDQLMSDMRLCLVYDADVYTPDPDSRAFIGDLEGYAKDATLAKINATFGQTCLTAAGATDEEKALYSGGLMIQVGPDTTGKGASSKAGWSVTQDGDTGVSVAEISVVFNVTGDAAAIAAGTKDIKLPATVASSNQYIKYTDGVNTAKQYATANADFAMANIMANMPAAPIPVIINPLKGQMRYGKAAGTYDVRALAYISGTDFDNIFKDKATAEGMIKEVGFVFARGANIEAPSMDAVKALVENGTVIDGYAKKPVSTISTSIDSGNYTIACTVTGIPESAATSEKLIAAAYIIYEVDGQTVYGYISNIQTIDFNTLYNSTNKPAQA